MGHRSALYTLINSEYQRLSREIEDYKKEIKKLPVGTIRIVSGRYVYLCYRKKGEYVSEYKGTIDTKEAKETMNAVKKRKMLKGLVKRLKLDLGEAESYLKAGEKYYKKHVKDYEPELETDFEDELA